MIGSPDDIWLVWLVAGCHILTLLLVGFAIYKDNKSKNLRG